MLLLLFFYLPNSPRKQWKWYLSEHIHPKFKWIIGLLLGVLVVADIAGIVYAVVYKVPKPKPQPKWFVPSPLPFRSLFSCLFFFMCFMCSH